MYPVKPKVGPKTYALKIVVGGAGGAGKTTLLERYSTNTFNKDTKLTVGVAFITKKISLEDGGMASFCLWDMGGQERFRFLQGAYCGGAHGYIAAFDMTRISTLYDDLNEWIELFRKYDPLIIPEGSTVPVPKPFVIIGTKKDLWNPEEGGIPRKEIEYKIQDLRAHYGYTEEQLRYFDTSSKTGEGVDSVFSAIISMVLDYNRLTDVKVV